MIALALAAVAALVVAAYFGGRERLRRALAGGAAAAVAAVFISFWARAGSPPAGFYGTGILFAFAAACAALSSRRFLATFASAAGALALVLWAVLAGPPEGEAARATWRFIPHAAAFMAGYVFLLAAASAAGASFAWKKKERELAEDARLASHLALAFLAAGAVLGAFAARAAWGEYWTWDAQESAALVPLALVAASRIAGAHTPAGRKLLIVAGVAAAPGYFALGWLPASSTSLHPG